MASIAYHRGCNKSNATSVICWIGTECFVDLCLSFCLLAIVLSVLPLLTIVLSVLLLLTIVLSVHFHFQLLITTVTSYNFSHSSSIAYMKQHVSYYWRNKIMFKLWYHVFIGNSIIPKAAKKLVCTDYSEQYVRIVEHEPDKKYRCCVPFPATSKKICTLKLIINMIEYLICNTFVGGRDFQRTVGICIDTK